MAYFLTKRPPFAMLNHGHWTRYEESWLISIQPGDGTFQVLAIHVKGPDYNTWEKFGYNEMEQDVEDAYKKFLNINKSGEISKEEATLILFESK